MNLPPNWTYTKKIASNSDGWQRGGAEELVWIEHAAGVFVAHHESPNRSTRAEAEVDAERMIWSPEPPPDREGLARALLGAFYDDVEQPLAEGEHARIWLSVADTAIRLCGGVRDAVPDGWPEGWRDDGYGDRVRQGVVVNHWRLPNTEPRRLAAWKLEGKDARPAEPAKSIWACPRHGGPQLDVVCPSCGMDLIEVASGDTTTALKTAFAEWEAHHRRAVAQVHAETVAAIESRDQADEAVATLQDLLKKANEEIEELKMRNRTLTDRLKLVESNLQQVHHDRDTQRAIVDHLRDMIVDIAWGQQ